MQNDIIIKKILTADILYITIEMHRKLDVCSFDVYYLQLHKMKPANI